MRSGRGIPVTARRPADLAPEFDRFQQRNGNVPNHPDRRICAGTRHFHPKSRRRPDRDRHRPARLIRPPVTAGEAHRRASPLTSGRSRRAHWQGLGCLAATDRHRTGLRRDRRPRQRRSASRSSTSPTIRRANSTATTTSSSTSGGRRRAMRRSPSSNPMAAPARRRGR